MMQTPPQGVDQHPQRQSVLIPEENSNKVNTNNSKNFLSRLLLVNPAFVLIFLRFRPRYSSGRTLPRQSLSSQFSRLRRRPMPSSLQGTPSRSRRAPGAELVVP